MFGTSTHAAQCFLRYPPVCGTTYPSPDCAELYVAKQSWSSGIQKASSLWWTVHFEDDSLPFQTNNLKVFLGPRPALNCAVMFVCIGWYESVIRQHNLNFSVVYTGLEGMSNILSDNSSTNRKLFYWCDTFPCSWKQLVCMQSLEKQGNHRGAIICWDVSLDKACRLLAASRSVMWP